MDQPESNESSIPARSHRQAMDWSLVLVSQGIDCSILHDDLGWRLALEPSERERATAVLAQYRRENRGWAWRERLSEAGADIHWGVIFWALGLGLLHAWTDGPGAGWITAGRMDSVAARHGEWWRLFTAVTLHADVAHLAANLTLGVLTLGLAMTRWGAGWGMLAAGLAGAAGNVCSLMIHPEAHFGLGASGMVMGALGLLAVPERAGGPHRGRGWRLLLRSLVGGILLFVLLGTNPSSDVAAHAGGFAAGLGFGWVLRWIPARYCQARWGNGVAILATVAIFSGCWVLAVTR